MGDERQVVFFNCWRKIPEVVSFFCMTALATTFSWGLKLSVATCVDLLLLSRPTGAVVQVYELMT